MILFAKAIKPTPTAQGEISWLPSLLCQPWFSHCLDGEWGRKRPDSDLTGGRRVVDKQKPRAMVYRVTCRSTTPIHREMSLLSK